MKLRIKYIAITVLIFLMTFIKGQTFKPLYEISSGDTLAKGQAVIYGNFIQRLGFSSGGFPQDIRIMNMDTKEVFAFLVKPTFKSTRENAFIYGIEPGTYVILNYWWTQSKWYGGKMFTEPIFKNVDATDNFEQKVEAGQIKTEELKQFTFTITKNSLNYLGTWNFEKGLVSFTDDKVQFDEKVKNKYKRLDFSTAKIVIPN